MLEIGSRPAFLLSVGKEENKIIGVSTKQVMNAKCSKMYHLNRHIVPQATESFIKSDYSVGPTFITKKILDLPNHIINLKMINKHALIYNNLASIRFKNYRY